MSGEGRKPPDPGGRAGGGGGGGQRGGARGGALGGGRRILPDGIRRELNRRRRVPNTASMSFEEAREMPTSGEFGEWMVEQGLCPSQGIQVKRISRSEHDARFYMQLENEEMVEKFLQAVGEEGREWKEERSGKSIKIKAKREGDDWTGGYICSRNQFPVLTLILDVLHSLAQK